jgi:hypothetical protein
MFRFRSAREFAFYLRTNERATRNARIGGLSEAAETYRTIPPANRKRQIASGNGAAISRIEAQTGAHSFGAPEVDTTSKPSARYARYDFMQCAASA